MTRSQPGPPGRGYAAAPAQRGRSSLAKLILAGDRDALAGFFDARKPKDVRLLKLVNDLNARTDSWLATLRPAPPHRITHDGMLEALDAVPEEPPTGRRPAPLAEVVVA